MRDDGILAKVKRELIVGFWKIMPVYTHLKVNQTLFKIPLQRELDHKIMGANREKWMDTLITLFFQHRQGVFIDIGAHAGQTLLKVKSLLPEAPYIGFEPNAYCLGYLWQLITLNQLKHCRVYPIALGERAELSTLYCHNLSDPKGTLVENFRERERPLMRQPVLLEQADGFLKRLSVETVAVVKIDVEGYEAAVLSGLTGILQRQRPFVICEVLRTHEPDYPSYDFRVGSRTRCEQLLHDVGYSIWAVKEGLPLVSWAHLDNACSNYVFAPQESAAVLTEVALPPSWRTNG